MRVSSLKKRPRSYSASVVEVKEEQSSDMTLENKFQHLIDTKPVDLYLDLCIRKTVLPRSAYIDVAEDLALNIDVSIAPEKKRFAMLVAMLNFISDSECLRYINQINPQLLPEAWKYDFLILKKICRKESVSDVNIIDVYLKSWQIISLATEHLNFSPPDYQKALQCYETSLQLNPKNARAIINLFFFLSTNKENPNVDVKRAEKLMLDSSALFSDNPVIALYLQALLAKYIYMIEYIEKPSLSIKQKISCLGFNVDEPYMQKISGTFIYLVKGKDAGRKAWYYVWVRPSQELAFNIALNNNIIHLENYGKIIYSAYGEVPPERMTNKVKEQYMIDADTPSIPNVLQQLLQESCIPFANQRRAQLIPEKRCDLNAGVTNMRRLSSDKLNIPREAIALGELLGRGRFGKVYKGSLNNSKIVAVKCYEDLNLPQRALTEALHEIEIMQSLQHSCLVSIIGYNIEPNSPLLVMQYGENGSLFDFLHSNKTITWGLRLKIAHDICLGLEYLHSKNYVHRDIKSMNVILFEDNRAKLSDFGLSVIKLHSTNSNPIEDSAHAGGSLRWMAPELFVRATAAPSSKSDIWALGMLFFEIASRALPFHDGQNDEQIKDWIKVGKGEDVPEECERLQPAFAALIKSCFQEKNKRPTASDLATHSVFKRQDTSDAEQIVQDINSLATASFRNEATISDNDNPLREQLRRRLQLKRNSPIITRDACLFIYFCLMVLLVCGILITLAVCNVGRNDNEDYDMAVSGFILGVFFFGLLAVGISCGILIERRNLYLEINSIEQRLAEIERNDAGDHARILSHVV